MSHMRPGHRLARNVRRLIAAAQALSGAAGVDHACREILAADGGEDFRVGASALDNDGTPLQLCVSASRRRAAWRVIGDPGAHIDDVAARHGVARAALRRALDRHGAGELAAFADDMLERLVPAPRPDYRNGTLWIGIAPGEPGVAAYAELAPLGRAAGWDAVGAWLAAALPDDGAARAIIGRLRQHCVAASAGFEGTSPGDARAKIYFRLATSMALPELGLDLLGSAPIMDFLRLAMGEFGVDQDGLVICIGFDLRDGALADVKVDLCGHCLAYAREEWPAVVARIAQRFALAPVPVRAALATHRCDVAFIGLGLDVAGEPRLNVYLKPGAPDAPPQRAELAAALADAVGYLGAIQHADGYWTDYRLPVGACDQWVTGYVGLALARYGRRCGDAAALAAAQAAARWLARARAYPAGWGYNASTGPDADSTAACIGLLHELGLPAAPADREFLRRHWRGPAGLATYEGPGAWGCGHWDVTPLGYLAMGEADRRQLRGDFLRGLAANRMADGMWRAYWWRTPCYSTFVTLEALEALGIAEPPLDAAAPRAIAIDNAFDLGCMIGVALLRGRPGADRGAHLRALLGWQRADGRWPGHANLRVTDDACYAPWDAQVGNDVGDYYVDEAGTITTATIVRVLTRLLAGRERAPPLAGRAVAAAAVGA
jgi:hypothetical protein